MARIVDELYAIAVKGGYTGAKPTRKAEAIAAITSVVSNQTATVRRRVDEALEDLLAVVFEDDDEGGGGGGSGNTAPAEQ